MLSFDTEEFDVPREHGVDISLEEGMRVSVEGTTRILDCLKSNGVRATFFCTGNFAEQDRALFAASWTRGTRWLATEWTIGNLYPKTYGGLKTYSNVWRACPCAAIGSPVCSP